MFLESIRIIETSPCIADPDLFKAITRGTASTTELLPYLNTIVPKPNYQPKSNSLMFKKGIVGFTLQDDKISITRFANMTEAQELLDWVKDLINDTYDRKDEIVPNHKGKKIVGVLKIYGLLPKTNCKECGESSCMAFASKMNKLDAEPDDCPLFALPEYQQLREKMLKAFAD